MEMIQINNLTKKYKDVVAVNNLNLKINQGELIALLGVNGSGKTTTIKMLSCLTKPTSGEAFIDEKSVVNNSLDVKKIIGVSPQETAIASNLTVKENLELICQIHGLKKDKIKEKIQLLSNQFELKEILNKKTYKLSGGYKRRISIAMALISEPEVLFLDEPTLGLDVISKSKLWDIINKLKRKKTIILTTHYLEEAEALSDKIAILNKGNLLFYGTSKELLEKSCSDKIEEAFLKIVRGK